MSRPTVAVVGAGMAGLAAARRIQDAGIATVQVFEDSDRLGGRAATVNVGDHSINIGAQFISDFYDHTIQMADDLGVALTQRSQTASIVRGEEPQDLWPARDLLTSKALSPLGKVRLLGALPLLLKSWSALDVHDLYASRHLDFETVSKSISRSCGPEVLEYFFGPLLRALLYWDPQTTSMTVANAALKAFITGHGTYHIEGGLGILANAMGQGLEVAYNCPATSVKASRQGVDVHTKLGEYPSDYAILCTTACTALTLNPGLGDFDFLKSVEYSSSIHLALSVDSASEDCPKGATIFPIGDSPEIASINTTYQRSPGKRRLLSVFFSDDGYERVKGLEDVAILGRAINQVTQVMGEQDWMRSAQLVHCQRWSEALPRFDVGYVKRLHEFRGHYGDTRVFLAGDYLAGPYIEGAVRSGEAAAEEVIRAITHG